MSSIKTLFSLSLVLLLITSCDPEPITPQPSPQPVDPDRVSFQNPVVGQFNTFDVLSFECGQAVPAPSSDLTLSITAVTDDEIEFSEQSSGLTDPYVYTAERVPGNLLISAEERAGSRLFYFYGSDSIRLDAQPVAELNYQDCVFFNGNEKFTGDYVASIPSFELEGRTLSNLKSVSCVPIILDLDGYLLYDSNNLHASITTSGSEFGGVESWFTTIYLLQEGGGE